MIGQRSRLRWASVIVLGVGLVLAFSVKSSPQSAPQPASQDKELAWEKYFVPDAPEPTFRFPVAHDHGLGSWSRFCSGYLYITEKEIRYEALRPAETRNHSFRMPRRAVLDAGRWRGLGPSSAAEFKFSGDRVYHFYLVHLETLDRNPHTLLKAEDVLPWPPVTEITMRFEGVLAQVRRHQAALAEAGQGQHGPVAEKPAPPEGPKLRIMEPLVVEPSFPVEVAQPRVTLRGAAVDSQGVRSVTVNDRQAELRSIGDIKAMEFSVKDLKLADGLNRVTVVATNIEHQSTQLNVLLWLRAKSDLPSTETAAVTVPPGAVSTPPVPKPLTEAQILELLRNDVASERVAMLVEQRGIDFEPSDDFVEALRRLGAQDVLMEALRKAKRAKPSAPEQLTVPH